MNRAVPLLSVVALTVILAGCGGGGGGGGGGSSGSSGGGGAVSGISISPSTLSFTANQDDADPPPAQTITITALGSGTTYIRGENGTVTSLTCSGASCTYQVRPTEAPYSFASPATTTNGLTFIGCADQTCSTGAVANGRQTVTYTYTITQGTDFAPNTPLVVNGVEGVPTPAQTLTLTRPSGTVPPWHASFAPGAGPSFVTLNPASTTTAGVTQMDAQFALLTAGTYTGTIEVQPGTSPRRVKRSVTYTVQSALSITGTLDFVIDENTQSGALQQTLTATAAAGVGTLGWTADYSASWLQLSNATGDTASANQVVLSLVTAELERLPKGVYGADITFKPSVPAAFSDRVVHVTLDMRLPHVGFVMPRAVAEGSTGEAFIRGSGFATLPGTVRFGITPAAGSPVRDSDTLMRANYPSTLARGNYNVDLALPANALQLNRAHARLTVADPTALQAAQADIDLPIGPKYAVVFDDARLALYVANVVADSPAQASTIERLVWNGTSWGHDSLPVDFLRDLVLRPGGDELLALTQDKITRVNPDAFSIAGTVTPLSQGPAYRSIGIGNDGRALISQSDAGGSNTNLIYYDLDNGFSAPDQIPFVTGNIRASGDGSVIYLLGDLNTRRYDVKTRTYTDNGALGAATGKVLSVSGVGTRFITDAAAVYRSDFTKLGSLAVAGDTLKAAVITPDGTRAYVYGASGTLYGFLLDSFVGADFAPAGTPIALPHLVNAPVMTTSADGHVVFIAGDDRVIVRPVP